MTAHLYLLLISFLALHVLLLLHLLLQCQRQLQQLPQRSLHRPLLPLLFPFQSQHPLLPLLLPLHPMLQHTHLHQRQHQPQHNSRRARSATLLKWLLLVSLVIWVSVRPRQNER